MKKKSLSIQIWLWFTTVILGIGVCLSLVFYIAMENFLEEQIYSQIEAQQQSQILQGSLTRDAESFESYPNTLSDFQIGKDTQRVHHEFIPIVNITDSAINKKETDALEIVSSNEDMVEGELVSTVASEILIQGKFQDNEVQRYEKTLGSDKLIYVISKQDIDNKPTLMYSYVSRNFNEMILSQFGFVFGGIIGVILISLILAKILAKRITKPLMALEFDMQKIANREWKNPIHVDGAKEILSLSESCERMRRQLIINDRNQQDLLQSLSHELKTPIMVIRSYLEAMRDGFYPSGNLEGSIDAIEVEAQRLQKRTLDLIYISNLQYFAHQQRNDEIVNLKKIILNIHDRMKYKRPDIIWNLQMDDGYIKGDINHWEIVIENLIQNQLRYSKSFINIRLEKNGKSYQIKISNDGPKIELNLIDKIFLPFEKGKDGESGLGLAIVKRIIDIYEGEIYVENLADGVEFIIYIPEK